MRQIGILQDEESTRKLVAYLLTEDVKTIAESDDQIWEIWIKEEDDLEKARALFTEFKAAPNDPKYSAALDRASQLVQDEQSRNQRHRENVVDMRGRWSKSQTLRRPLVVILMIITAAVFMVTNGWEYQSLGNGGVLPERTAVLNLLLFVNPDDARTAINNYVESRLEEYDAQSEISPDASSEFEDRENYVKQLQEEALDSPAVKLTNISRGQYWRLFTPIFIHFGILHILFNMLWLNSLGSQVEHFYGTFRFGLFVIAAAIFSQLLQQLMPSEWQGSSAVTMCGGMSGVNYALAGFVWIKTVCAPERGLFLSPINMFILVAWMFMGIFDGGRTLAMANWAHGGGFVFGLAVAYLPEVLRSKKKS